MRYNRLAQGDTAKRAAPWARLLYPSGPGYFTVQAMGTKMLLWISMA